VKRSFSIVRPAPVLLGMALYAQCFFEYCGTKPAILFKSSIDEIVLQDTQKFGRGATSFLGALPFQRGCQHQKQLHS
jgi:hypothetical protein